MKKREWPASETRWDADRLRRELDTVRAKLRAVQEERDRLREALRQIEAIYEKDRVQHTHARAIENIFDTYLHGDAQGHE